MKLPSAGKATLGRGGRRGRARGARAGPRSALPRRACAATTTPTRAARSRRRSTSTTGSTATIAARSTSSRRAKGRRSCSRTASRCRCAPGSTSSSCCPKPGSAPIAYDHRGHGESVLGEAGHSLENLAEDVKTVVTGLDLRDAILVGHSMGGVAVQSFVLRYPELAARARARHRAPVDARAHAVRVAFDADEEPAREGLQPRARLRAAVEEQEPRPPARARSASARIRIRATSSSCGSMMLACPAETRRDAPRVLVGLDLLDDLPKVEIPTLVIGGTADVLTPPAYAKQIANAIPGARLELVPDGGHMLMLERTDALDQLIVDFAREVGVTAVSLLPVPGVRAGHWTGTGTGVTVVVFPAGTVGSGEVRGGAPATREFALLEPASRRRSGRRGRAHRRIRVRARDGRRCHALPRRARAAGSRRPADRCRSCRPRRSSISSKSGARRPGASEGYAAAVMSERDDALEVGRRGAGAGRDGRQVARSRPRGARRPRNRARAGRRRDRRRDRRRQRGR